MSDPNWYPDPMGRYELRYYDGVRWTAHVATAGVASTDPLPDQQTPTAAANQVPAAGFDPAAQGLANQPAAGALPGFGGQPPQENWQLSQASPGSNKGVIGILAAIGAVVVLFGIGAFLVFGGDSDDSVEAAAGSDDADDDDNEDDATGSSTTGTAPSTTAPPTTSQDTVTSSTGPATTVGAPPIGGVPAAADPRVAIPEYGSDPAFDALADACEDGEMQACDDLFIETPIGSGYEAYGDSCGQRNEPAGYCATIYPGAS